MAQASACAIPGDGQMVVDKENNVAVEYDSYGLVTLVRQYNAPAYTLAEFKYDDHGMRLAKKVYNPSTGALDHTLWYVNGPSGNNLFIYKYDESTSTLSEYEASIQGMNSNGKIDFNGVGIGAGIYYYGIYDHTGTVRSVVKRDASGNAEVDEWSDYYPWGMVMPGRNLVNSPKYRQGYQGQFTEHDDETGWDAFELRMLDARMGRWMATDPYNQYHSPYVSMGNNPVSSVDADGGLATGLGALIGATAGGLAYTIHGMTGGKTTPGGLAAAVLGGAAIGAGAAGGFGGGGSGGSGGGGFNPKAASDFLSIANGAQKVIREERRSPLSSFERKPLKPFPTGDSRLEFDGGSLRQYGEMSDGGEELLNDWPATSGPWGNGPLPEGEYIGNNLRRRTTPSMMVDGFGFSLDLTPQFNTNRTLLRIHPDGNVPGTLGCIGLICGGAGQQSFYNSMKIHFRNSGTNFIRVRVRFITP